MNDKKYIVETVPRTAKPRSKRLRESGGAGGGVTIRGGGSTIVPGSTVASDPNSHLHDNKALLDKLATDNDRYLYLNEYLENEEGGTMSRVPKKVKVGYADEAGHAAEAEQATKADNADKWDGEHFADWLDQALHTTDDVRFNSVAAELMAAMRGIITPGIGSDNFIQKVQGWRIFRTAGGYTVGEFDDVVARRKASFNTVELRETAYMAGNYVFGPAGSVISKVEPVDEAGNVLDIDLTQLPAQWAVQPFAFRCFMVTDDGDIATINAWRAGDQAMRETFNIKSGVYQGVENQYYWRCVERVGEDYVDLSWTNAVEGCNDTLAGVPKVGDKICCEGHQTAFDMVKDSEGNPVLDEDGNPLFNTDEGRFGFIEIVTTGQRLVSFTVYDGVTDFSKTRRNWVFRVEGNLIYRNAKNIITLHDGVEIQTPQYAGDWLENYNGGLGYCRPLWVTYDGCGWDVVLPRGEYTLEPPIVYDGDIQGYRQSLAWHLMYGTPSLIKPLTIFAEYDEGNPKLTATHPMGVGFTLWRGMPLSDTLISDVVWDIRRRCLDGDGTDVEAFDTLWNASDNPKRISFRTTAHIVFDTGDITGATGFTNPSTFVIRAWTGVSGNFDPDSEPDIEETFNV